jgi:hypothetical protein
LPNEKKPSVKCIWCITYTREMKWLL